MNNVVYARFLEDNRLAYLKKVNFGNLLQQPSMVVAHQAIDYLRVIDMDDTVDVMGRIHRWGRSSFEFAHEIRSATELKATATVRCVFTHNGKSCEIPESFRAAVMALEHPNTIEPAKSANPPLPTRRRRVLMVLTSHAMGWYPPEFVHPYAVFTAAQYEVAVASIAGGAAPLSPFNMADMDSETQHHLPRLMDIVTRTKPLHHYVPSCKDFDAVYFVGGFGTMFDFPTSDAAVSIIQAFLHPSDKHKRIVSAVCHGPIVLANVKTPDGKYLLEGMHVTGFSNAEEAAAGKASPFCRYFPAHM